LKTKHSAINLSTNTQDINKILPVIHNNL